MKGVFQQNRLFASERKYFKLLCFVGSRAKLTRGNKVGQRTRAQSGRVLPDIHHLQSYTWHCHLHNSPHSHATEFFLKLPPVQFLSQCGTSKKLNLTTLVLDNMMNPDLGYFSSTKLIREYTRKYVPRLSLSIR